ncbi:MAG: hypothetical protein ABJA81_07365, partial [Nocardioidaceae bacterium]
MIVPRLADWCAVQTLDDDKVDNIAIAHVNPERSPLPRTWNGAIPPAPTARRDSRKFDLQTGELARITRIAEAAQHAILAPV